MAFVGAEALAVGTVPGGGNVVFANGEDEVAFLGESRGIMSALAADVEEDGKPTYLTWVSARSCPDSRMGLILATVVSVWQGEGGCREEE